MIILCRRQRSCRQKVFLILKWIIYFQLLIICVYFVQRIVIRNWLRPELITRIDYVWPEMVEFPSITICAPAIIAPKRLAELYPVFNKSYQSFLENSEDNNKTNINQRNEMFQWFQSRALNQYTVFQLINEGGVELKELVRSCVYNPITYRNRDWIFQGTEITSIPCDKYKTVLPTIYQKRKCFTYFSNLVELKQEWTHFVPNATLLDGSKSKFTIPWDDRVRRKGNFFRVVNQSFNHLTFDLNPSIEIGLRMSDKLFGYIPNYEILVIVHPPTVLANKQDFTRLSVKLDTYYDLAYTRRAVNWEALPHCMDNTDHNNWGNWTQDNYQNYCIRMHSYNQRQRCINPYAMVNLLDMEMNDAKNWHICGDNQTDFMAYLEAKNRCQVRQACKELFYEISGVVQTAKLHTCHRGPHGLNPYCSSTVAVRLSPCPFKNITYLRPLTEQELFGAIGGHFGIWLGLSTFTVVNFAITWIFVFVRSMLNKLNF